MPRNKAVNFQPVHFEPAAGFLDTRSTPDTIPAGGYRWALNIELTHTKRLCRSMGFRKLLSLDANYNNSDLHDQLGYSKEQITFGFQAESPAGFTKLFVGTQNRLYALSPGLDNWNVISDLLGGTIESGCPERRWRAGQIDSTVIFTNNFNEPVYHIIDQPDWEGSGQSVSTIRDLQTLKITKAEIALGWNNLMFLANIVEDGERRLNRIMWSDYQRPLSFVPKPGKSLAGNVDLDSGEAILAIMPLVDRILVYTTRGIWEGTAVGGDTVMQFNRRYKAPKENLRCLAYPNTLVSTGGEHYYWGLDGIYKYSLYDPEPVLVDWIHRATAYIFNDINKAKCKAHVGAYNEQKKTIVWSWAKSGEQCPTMSIMVNTEFPFCSFMDHGFSMLLNYEPDQLMTLRDFIYQYCICTPNELEIYGGGLSKEGGRACVSNPIPSCNVRPTCFYSTASLVDGEVTSEDYTGSADADSLFSILGSLDGGETCAHEYESDECNADQLFIGASTTDMALKEFANVYYREMLSSMVACSPSGYRGVYQKQGYRSKLTSGALHMREPDHDKRIRRFAIEQHPVPAVKPSQIILRIGVAANAVDPLTAGEGCVIMWESQTAKVLQCLSALTAEQHRAVGTRPNIPMEWGLHYEGRYLYFELEILNNSVTPKDTGGAVCFSRFTLDVGLHERILR